MVQTYDLSNRNDMKKFIGAFKKPIDNITSFWKLLHIQINQAVQLAFRTQGRSNGKGWVGFSPRTLKTKAGTWNIRYGTDLKGRSSYTPGKIRPGVRRYSDSSKLLQASGGFRQSWNFFKMTNRHMIFGTVHKLAKQIMSNPDRPVLVVTNMMIKRWQVLFAKFYSKRLKFT